MSTTPQFTCAKEILDGKLRFFVQCAVKELLIWNVLILPMTFRKNKMRAISSYFVLEHFHDGVPYHIETSPLLCSANQWTGFYMVGPL